MAKIGEYVKSADWKAEKHVPVIDCPDEVKADEVFEVKVGVGKEIAHPNTTEHHIRWIALMFMADGGKFVQEVARVQFSAHGESVDGPNKGPVYTYPQAVASIKMSKSGTLHAVAYCNIHGLWESSKEIKLG